MNIRSGGGNIGDISGLVGSDGVVNLDTSGGNVTNTLNQLPDFGKLMNPTSQNSQHGSNKSSKMIRISQSLTKTLGTSLALEGRL